VPLCQLLCLYQRSIESKQYFAGTKKRHPLQSVSHLKKWLNYVAGPLLFIAIAFSIYKQLSSQQDLAQHWQQLVQNIREHGTVPLICIVLLMLLNWSIEALKWQQLVNHLMPIGWWKALLGVLAGVSFTMLTPNRMGEFLGRVLYLPDGSRMKAATLTAMSSMSQLIITMTAGIMGILYWYSSNVLPADGEQLLMRILLFGTLLACIAVLLLYFNAGWMVRWMEKWPAAMKYAPIVHAVGEINRFELLKILGLAALRYIVFLIQYVLVFMALQLPIHWLDAIAATAILFLILAVVPSISLAELGIRGKVSLLVFGWYCQQAVGILLAAAVIWFINIILPALAGSLILLGVKLFGKNTFEKA